MTRTNNRLATDQTVNSLARLARQLLPPQQTSRRQRRRRARNPSAPRGTQTTTMPAAYATHVTPYFRSSAGSRDTLRLAGCDLVRPISSTAGTGAGNIFAVIPANPAYWEGTKIAAIASAYFNYRPIRLRFHYVPQVPVTVAGTVVSGTLWCGQSASDSLQQTLVTSNGGIMTQCYVPANSELRLGNVLPQRMFYMQGEFGYDTNPFVWVALNAGGLSGSTSPETPGYYFVEYVYELSNPLGQGAVYNRQIVDTLPTSALPAATSCVITNGSETIPAGSILKYDEGSWYDQGDQVETTGLTGVVFSFRPESAPTA